jgi:hypothetical protein
MHPVGVTHSVRIKHLSPACAARRVVNDITRGLKIAATVNRQKDTYNWS